MFSKLVNEAALTFKLRTETPLLINSGSNGKIRPGYDMSPVVTLRNGEPTVYIPGSSIKGVIRTRYEQLIAAVAARPCNVVDGKSRCKPVGEDGTAKYKACCHACRLFGNLGIGSRIHFADAYPIEGEKLELGFRHGVAINRITGGVFGNAKFDYQMVEHGTFEVKLTMQNFALYQLRLILAVLQDIDAGLVAFGMGGTRGNGRMKLEGSVRLGYRHTDGTSDRMRGYFKGDVGGEIGKPLSRSLFGSQWELDRLLDDMIAIVGITDKDALIRAIAAEQTALEAV